MAQKQCIKMSIKECLRNAGKESMKGFFQDDNGKELSDKEAREYLNECLENGEVYLPVSETPCDKFSKTEGCTCFKESLKNKQP